LSPDYKATRGRCPTFGSMAPTLIAWVSSSKPSSPPCVIVLVLACAAFGSEHAASVGKHSWRPIG
jgi:hypothetical protein